MSRRVTYGLGGFDSAHPNGNVTETLEDDHAGTLTRTVYLPVGSVDFVEVNSIPVTAPYEPLGATGADVSNLNRVTTDTLHAMVFRVSTFALTDLGSLA